MCLKSVIPVGIWSITEILNAQPSELLVEIVAVKAISKRCAEAKEIDLTQHYKVMKTHISS